MNERFVQTCVLAVETILLIKKKKKKKINKKALLPPSKAIMRFTTVPESFSGDLPSKLVHKELYSI